MWLLRGEACYVNVCIDILPHHGELCQAVCERLQVCMANMRVAEVEFRCTEEDVQWRLESGGCAGYLSHPPGLAKSCVLVTRSRFPRCHTANRQLMQARSSRWRTTHCSHIRSEGKPNRDCQLQHQITLYLACAPAARFQKPERFQSRCASVLSSGFYHVPPRVVFCTIGICSGPLLRGNIRPWQTQVSMSILTCTLTWQ